MLFVKIIKEVKSRKKIIASIVLLVSIFLLCSRACTSYGGSSYLFRFFAVPVREPCFADLRTITAGAESRKQGFDPMIKNPGDPWNRVMNYPRIWQSLYLFRIDESDTVSIGILFVSLFLFGVCLVLPNAPNVTILTTILALLSPVVLLGIERGNTDLFMFFLIALAVFLINKNKFFLSSIVILSAVFLKLFPIFAAVTFFRSDKKRSFRFLGIVTVVFIVYLAVTFPDLILISKGTPRPVFFAFGKDVVWIKTLMINESFGVFVKYCSYLILAICAVTAFFMLFRNSLPVKFEESLALDSFRAGAIIYIGTFLLGSNFIYRLMFLIFVIPQLVIWIQSFSGKYKILSFTAFFLVMWLLWEPMIAKIIRHTLTFFPEIIIVFNFVDEFFAWALFVLLLFFVCSDIGKIFNNKFKLHSF
ncbi:DUF2029 domain-containing protein [bacterium]|nr:DUF2029 domain-containing protein [bacterium]